MVLEPWTPAARGVQTSHCYSDDCKHIDYILLIYTSSTAQGGGGSPIGEIGCCESGMAERIH